MSQQALVPEPQDGQNQQSGSEEELYAPPNPYTWSGKSNAEATPRDEPPSSYEYEAGYQAQDAYSQDSYGQDVYTQDSYANESSFDTANAYTQSSQQAQQQQYQSPYDSNVSNQAYTPYNNYTQSTPYQGVPPYARPQQQSFNPWRFSSILLVVVIIGFLGMLGPGLFGFGFHGFGALGGTFFPILIFLMIFRSFGRGGRRRFRGGPWRW